MTFVITQPCIDVQDQSCVDVCPVDCIHFEEGADRMLYIDPVECIDCGACQPACPVSAIFPEADVPADQKPFIEINQLWYSDPAAARAKVPGGEGGGGAATPAPTSAPAATAAEPAGASEDEAAGAQRGADEVGEASAAPVPATESASIGESAAAAPDAGSGSTPPPALEPVAAYAQVPAGGAIAMSRPMPSPIGLVSILLFATVFYILWTFPGPIWLTIGGVGIGATVVVLLPLALILALVMFGSQASMLSRFSARHERVLGDWRAGRVEWRRSEESRRFALERTVLDIARDRFAYPSEANPELRTYVNLPEPQMALEMGGGEKLFPDIVVTQHPGNYPVMVAQVETRETLTREQAHYVWKRLENKNAPLYVYVPAGMVARAEDYAKDAGLKNYRLRTWRNTPQGMLVREL